MSSSSTSTTADQVFDEWNSMVSREDDPAYAVQHAAPSHEDDGPCESQPINRCPTEMREEICDWCYQVVDHCSIDRGVVGVALSYFDRYLAASLSSATNTNQALIQLVAMTSLYLAVKVHSTRKISAVSMASLSRGSFRVDQITKMEVCIIKTLRWHLHPPTPFLYLVVAEPLLLETDEYSGQAESVRELARYLIELSVCDGYFVGVPPSSVAYAAVSVATDVLNVPMKGSFLSKHGYDLKHSPCSTELCAARLRQVYRLALPQLEEADEAVGRGGGGGSSPTSVFM